MRSQGTSKQKEHMCGILARFLEKKHTQNRLNLDESKLHFLARSRQLSRQAKSRKRLSYFSFVVVLMTRVQSRLSEIDCSTTENHIPSVVRMYLAV